MFRDRLAVMDKGRVVASGTPQEVLTETLLREVFDVDARIGPSPASRQAAYPLFVETATADKTVWRGLDFPAPPGVP
jgi:ABC-type hemin transport system ATPase subunit|tara:strand:+ start:8775 stop:9005 length:231 start_codon:yes stop_codon:yes gene_type:complete